MKILFVPGIKTWPFYMWGWKHDLHAMYGAENVRIMKRLYVHYQHAKIHAFTEEVTKEIDAFKPDIVLAHSFGGLIAKAAIVRAVHVPAQCVTMATPHTMDAFGVNEARQCIHTPSTVAVHSLVTFGGSLDMIVPEKYTRLPQAVHYTLPVGHMSFLLRARTRRQVLAQCLQK